MAIYKSKEGHFSISSHQVWLPGCYDTERAAKYAFRFQAADLQALQDSVNPDGLITFSALQQLKKNKGKE